MNRPLRELAAPLLLLLACAWLLPGLGLYPLLDVDEGAFAEATREMLQSGNWVSTTLNGLPRYDKPILIYWLEAVSVGVFGLDEFALRLPSAVATLAWLYTILRFVSPRWGRELAVRSAWITCTSLGVLAMGRAATADALLNVLLAISLFDLWRYLEVPDPGAPGIKPGAAAAGAGVDAGADPSASAGDVASADDIAGAGAAPRAALRRAYLWIALGLLTKGPIALLIPVAVAGIYCASAGRWRAARAAASDPLGWLILLAVAAPWYTAQLALHGREFVDGFLVRHNLDRFNGTLEGHGGTIGYYLLVLPLLLLPWSGLLWRAARSTCGAWGDPLQRYLALWFGFVLVFFSLSGTKLPHYLLYGMTPVFLLIARQLTTHAGTCNRLLLPCALLVCLPAVPHLLQIWSEHSSAGQTPPFYVAQARRAAESATASYYAVTGLSALVGLALATRRRWPVGQRAMAASGLLVTALVYGFVPWLGEVLNGPQRRAALLAATLPGTAVQWNLAAPSFSVYRRQSTPARPPQPGELAITRTDRLDPQVPVDILFREGGVALVRRR